MEQLEVKPEGRKVKCSIRNKWTIKKRDSKITDHTISRGTGLSRQTINQAMAKGIATERVETKITAFFNTL